MSRLTVAWPILLLACDPPVDPVAFCDGEVQLDYAPSVDTPYTTFPDDFWTVEAETATGLQVHMDPATQPAFADFPENYLDWFDFLSTLDGWGTGAGVYFRFDDALPIDAIGPEDVFLVSLGADGPTFHDPEITFTDYDRTLLLKPRLALPSRTRIIAGLLTDPGDDACVAPSTYLRELLDPEGTGVSHSLSSRYLDGIAALGVDPSRIAAMTVYTTQDATSQGVAVATDVSSRSYAISASGCTDAGLWRRCEGMVEVKDYRDETGLVPYGDVEARSSYVLPLSAWLPPGAGPFPVVICGHGLGGDRGQCEGIAEEAAGNGLALIGVDAVEHGDHPGRTEADIELIEPLMIFALRLSPPGINGLLLRDNFRQSAWDKLQLIEAIRAGVDFDADGIVDLDGDRVGYAGVSLGGIMGAEPMALSPHLKAGMLVVGGARVTQIIEDSPTFSILIDLMKPPGTDGGEVDRAFPLLQTMMDPGDPMTWAPHVQAGRFDNADPPDVMLMDAYLDEIVPNSTNDLLAMAFSAPGVGTERWPVHGIDFASGSVTANGPGGASVGLVQFMVVHENGLEVAAEHDNVHDSDEGLAAIDAFFTPVFEGTGRGLITDPDAD